VLRAIAESGRDDIAMYTGNDDAIVSDLLTDFPLWTGGGMVRRRIVGGLLGQWAVWTKRAVEWLDEIRAWRDSESSTLASEWLSRGAALTVANGSIFDAANGFAGCIPGILEVLRSQGLVRGTWTLDAGERLSPGQAASIALMAQRYPMLTDDDFVAAHLEEWLR
jgi:hypothetical protein